MNTAVPSFLPHDNRKKIFYSIQGIPWGDSRRNKCLPGQQARQRHDLDAHQTGPIFRTDAGKPLGLFEQDTDQLLFRICEILRIEIPAPLECVFAPLMG